jgi:hypothetical protein
MQVTSLDTAAARPRKRRIWPIILGLFLITGTASLYYLSKHLGPGFRLRAIEVLREHYQSDVKLKSLDISLFPQIAVKGEELALYVQGRTDLPPLIFIKHFSLNTHLSDILTGPRRVHNLHLDGLKITITRGAAPPKDASGANGAKKKIPKFVIDDVVADGAVLEIIPVNKDK